MNDLFIYLTRESHACLNLQLQETEKICVIWVSKYSGAIEKILTVLT
jgi:hypothetical protein